MPDSTGADAGAATPDSSALPVGASPVEAAHAPSRQGTPSEVARSASPPASIPPVGPDTGSPAHADAAPQSPGADLSGISAVIRIKPFRRLWLVLALSSLGDWLGLLATSLFAAEQVESSTAKGAAFGGVIVVQLLPALLLGPVAGVFADRFDRRVTMVFCDVGRFLLTASIPTAALLLDNAAWAITWTYVATFSVGVLSLFWIPAKEASVPNLVPKEKLEGANQITLVTTFGITPVVAALLLAGVSRALLSAVDEDVDRLWISPVDMALYVNAFSFIAAAVVVFFIPQISQRSSDSQAEEAKPGLVTALWAGWQFVRGTAVVRGLVYGILGAFAAGGTVIGVAKFYATSLSGGDAAFSLLFGTLFIGLGAGMAGGPSLVKALSRRRWFGISIVLAGVSVALLALAPHLAVAVPLTFLVGAGAGMAYLSGSTLLGIEVADAMRGRIFAFVQSMVRVVLMLAIAISSLLVGLGGSRGVDWGAVEFKISAARILLAIGGALGVCTGVLAFRRMDDKPGVPVIADLLASLRGRPLAVPSGEPTHGFFVAFEGGEGAGKSTQASRLASWLRERGHHAVLTHEPGATKLGAQLRKLLLASHGEAPTSRTEALMYAADRAQHVETLIRPELSRGSVVLTDRYVDSSLAYQGAGRTLRQDEIAWLSDWATGGLKPDLVVLLDISPAKGLSRAGKRGDHDRLEAESLAFHERVRQGFLDLADEHPERYLVLDADTDAEALAVQIRERVAELLPAAAAIPAQESVLEAQQR